MYYDNSQKIKTESGGVTVTGTVAATSYTGDGSNLTGISAGTSLSGSTNNTVCTVTGANAIQGEANLTFDGSVLTNTGSTLIGNDIKSASDDFFVYSYKGGSDGQVRSGIQFDSTNQRMEFYTGTNERARIDSSGRFGIGTNSPTDKLHVNGTALISSNLYLNNNTYLASNKGIYFDGGTSAANHLDDYEEGSFTPTARGNNNNSSPVISGSGTYTKIGKLVQINLSFANENGSYLPGGEYLQIHGLPFTASGTHVMGMGMNYKVVFNSSYQYYFYMPSGGTIMWGYYNKPDLPYQPWGTDQWDNTQWYHENTFTYMTAS